jgi:hypothetical protein
MSLEAPRNMDQATSQQPAPAAGQEQPAKRRTESGDAWQDISKLEADLWAAADNLRANSKLTSSDYSCPCWA